jgi:Fungal specific transcription factor domain
MFQQNHQRELVAVATLDLLTRAVLPERGLYSNPSSSRTSPEMFDYPGLASQLYTIAQAVHFPAEYMVHILQIAELGQWKNIQDNNGTLSYRELARRGKDIERVLLGQIMPSSGYVKNKDNGAFFSSGYSIRSTFHNAYPMASTGQGNYSPSAQNISLMPTVGQINYSQPLSSSYAQSQFSASLYAPQPPVVPQSYFATAVAQSSQSQLICTQTCLFMLHCVISGPNPRVPELAGAARNITTRFASIPVNERSAVLIFPLCIAAILADDTEMQYIQTLINTLGGSPELMQAVNGIIVNVRQSRWTHEFNNANPLIN